MDQRQNSPKRKREFIEQLWERSNAKSVGEFELNQIQDAITREFGSRAVESPAWIARVLAEKGARLRHPEIIHADTNWRTRRLFELFGPDDLSFETLAEAELSLAKLEELRVAFARDSDVYGLERLRTIAVAWKEQLQLRSESKTTREKRLVAREIAQWLTVWLQDAAVFANWLDLRQNSPEFLRDFGR